MLIQGWHLAAAKGFFGRLADLADRPMANGQNWQPKHDWEIGRGQSLVWLIWPIWPIGQRPNRPKFYH